MDTLIAIVKAASDFLWEFLLILLLCGAGVYFTIRLRFIQVRRLGKSLRMVFGGVRLRGDKAGAEGMSSFQSLTTAVAAQVGTGNLAGAATAIVSGGPGAIFWMWVSAFFGMATIFAEATLAQRHKARVEGEVTGGPVYYIRAAFGGRFGRVLAGIFSVLIILALGFMGNMVQSNSIGFAFQTAFGIPPWAVGLGVAGIAAFVFLGGVRRLASITEKLVPLMAVLYILGSLAILALNWRQIGPAFGQIFGGAFAPQSVLGGAMGVTVQQAIRYGVARGLFSNEAGMGSTPHAHAVARVRHPCDQGAVAMVGVFIDTFIILTLTALVILTTGVLGTGKDGIELTQGAFVSVFGPFGNWFIAASTLFFAFSTIIGWYFFGEVNVRYLLGKRAVKGYALLVVVFVLLGAQLRLDLVWNLSDLFNGLMVIPNLLALLALGGSVVALERAHERAERATAAGQGTAADERPGEEL